MANRWATQDGWRPRYRGRGATALAFLLALVFAACDGCGSADPTPTPLPGTTAVFSWGVASGEVRTGSAVLWTRGRWKDNDPTPQIREWFRESGFDEIAFHGPDDETYTVGANRYTRGPIALVPGETLFRFFR